MKKAEPEQQHEVVGSPDYIAVEVIRGEVKEQQLLYETECDISFHRVILSLSIGGQLV